MPRAVLFDMYETLVTLHAAPHYFGADIARDLHIPESVFLPLWRETDEGRTLGRLALADVLRHIQRQCRAEDDDALQTALHKRHAVQDGCFAHLHPHILAMLSALRGRSIPVGVVSNCYREEAAAIRRSPLAPYLDALALSCEAGSRKPDAALYLRCTDALGVSPADCLYVGDGGSHELDGARALGMDARQARWYLRPGAKQPVGPLPDFPHVDDPLDVLSCFP